MACALSEDSDQPGHLPSLIRVFAVRMKKAWVLSYPLSTQRRLWSDAQADLSLRWAHNHFVGFVMRQLNIMKKYSEPTKLDNSWLGLIWVCSWAYMWTLPDHPGASRKCGNAARLPHSREWDRTSRMWKYKKKKKKKFFFFFFYRPSFMRICMVIMVTCCWKAINS